MSEVSEAAKAREWRAGAFTVRTDQGEFQIAGWICEPFALDFRVWETDDDWYDRGWALTHLPTGFVAAGILAPLNQAFSIADEMNACADWDFTDPMQAQKLRKQVHALQARHEGLLVLKYPTFGPLFAMRDAA